MRTNTSPDDHILEFVNGLDMHDPLNDLISNLPTSQIYNTFWSNQKKSLRDGLEDSLNFRNADLSNKTKATVFLKRSILLNSVLSLKANTLAYQTILSGGPEKMGRGGTDGQSFDPMTVAQVRQNTLVPVRTVYIVYPHLTIASRRQQHVVARARHKLIRENYSSIINRIIYVS